MLVCAYCEKRNDGPRHLKSKAGVSALRQASREVPGKVKVSRTRYLGLCPCKALAAVGLGVGLPAMAAELRDVGDFTELMRYAGSTTG